MRSTAISRRVISQLKATAAAALSYAAAKAGGEFCRSYVASYGTDVVITRGCNTIGPRQYPEKLIPLFITNAMRDNHYRSTATACRSAIGSTSMTPPRRSTCPASRPGR